jgi:hypothetical protein
MRDAFIFFTVLHHALGTQIATWSTGKFLAMRILSRIKMGFDAMFLVTDGGLWIKYDV